MKILLLFSIMMLSSCATINKYSLDKRIELIKKNVVLLNFERSVGSGTLISYEGQNYILTNDHVCHSRMKFNGDKFSVEGYEKTTDMVWNSDNVYADKEIDLCLIKVPLKGMKIGDLLDNKSGIPANDNIFYYTLNREWNDLSLVEGKYRSIEKNLEIESSGGIGMVSIYTNECLSYEMDVHRGDSGSLAYNRDAQIVGVVFGQGIVENGKVKEGLLVTVEKLKEFLKNIK